MPIPSIGQIPIANQEQIKETLKQANDTASASPPGEEHEIQKRYDSLVPRRQPYLDEARRISQAVMPYLYPPEGCTDDIFQTPSANQSLVAKGVFNLSKKLGVTIFPSNGRFFEYKILPEVAQEVEDANAQADEGTAKEAAAAISSINNQLVKRSEVMRESIKASPDAQNVFNGIMHSIVSGTSVFFKPNLDTSKIYTLEDFVCEFDSSGDLVEVIVRDVIHPSKFKPEDLKKLFNSSDLEKFEKANFEGVVVLTRQIRRYDHWEIQVEIAGKRFEPMEGKEELDSPPFMVIPFFLLPKKSYGLGWLSHNKGDIIQFENLSLSVNELSKAASKIVALIPPDMKVTQKELADTAGMSYIFGAATPIQMVLADISKNLSSVMEVYQLVRSFILGAFLLEESIRRDAERVTEYELQQMMKMLQDLLGGLYFSLARFIQRPYVTRTDRLMVHSGRLPELPDGTFQLALTAGLETMEAAEDLQAHDQYMARMAQIPGAIEGVNVEEYKMRTANQLGVVTDRLLLTEDEQMDKAGVRQIVEMSRQLGPQGPQMLAHAVQMMIQNMQSVPQQQGDNPPPPPTEGQVSTQ